MKRKHTQGRVIWSVVIPTPLAVKVDEKLKDPLFRKTKYGSKSTLISLLLSQWVAQQPEESERELNVGPGDI